LISGAFAVVFSYFYYSSAVFCHSASIGPWAAVLDTKNILSYSLPIVFTQSCHAQSLAATNRVTEQLNLLTVESFFMSCSISWMASLIDNLYLLDLIVLVIN
jgi:hypothetical protein